MHRVTMARRLEFALWNGICYKLPSSQTPYSMHHAWNTIIVPHMVIEEEF